MTKTIPAIISAVATLAETLKPSVSARLARLRGELAVAVWRMEEAKTKTRRRAAERRATRLRAKIDSWESSESSGS